MFGKGLILTCLGLRKFFGAKSAAPQKQTKLSFSTKAKEVKKDEEEEDVSTKESSDSEKGKGFAQLISFACADMVAQVQKSGRDHQLRSQSRRPPRLRPKPRRTIATMARLSSEHVEHGIESKMRTMRRLRTLSRRIPYRP